MTPEFGVFEREFRMPWNEKGVTDTRAEKVFSGIQAASNWRVDERGL